MVTHFQTTREDDRANVYRAISDPTRRAILDKLRRGPTPVISKHLRILRAAHLVKERRSGRERHYRLEPKPLRDVARWLEEYRNLWEHNLNRLKQHLENESGGA